MSWDADLICDACGHAMGDWNFTHNTNPMIDAVLPETAATRTTFWGGRSWWDLLHGMGGAAGAAFLNEIVVALEAEPDRFRAMNPPNGWGNYDALLGVLVDMRDRATTEVACTWKTSG